MKKLAPFVSGIVMIVGLQLTGKPVTAAGNEDRIAKIRQLYDEVEALSDSKKETLEFECVDGPGSGSVTRFQDSGGRVRKVALDHTPSDHGGYETTFYYSGVEPVFILQKAFSWQFDGENPDGSSKTRDSLRERRYYFDEGRCLRMLQREASATNPDDLEREIAKQENQEMSPEEVTELLKEGRKAFEMKSVDDVRAFFCQ